MFLPTMARSMGLLKKALFPIIVASAAAGASAQSVLWWRSFDSVYGLDDFSESVAVDSANNVYVAGESNGLHNYDILLIKYSPSGSRLWTRRLDGPGHGLDASVKVSVGSSDNIVLAGYVTKPNGTTDIELLKYDPSGQRLWEQRYNGPANSFDYPWAMSTDSSGNIYIAGDSVGVGTNYDYLTLKYSATGVLQWARRYNGSGGAGIDVATALTLDPNLNVLVTGVSYNPNTAAQDYVTTKYAPDGSLLWRKTYAGDSSQEDNHPVAIASDANGNAVVFGTLEDTGGVSTEDWILLKYGAAGTLSWQRRYDDPLHGRDLAIDAAVDASGNIYLTGGSLGTNNDADYLTVKYSPTGSRLWVRRFNGAANLNDLPEDLTLDANGNVVITGYSHGTNGFDDILSVKYSPTGQLLWGRRFGYAAKDAYGIALAVDSLSNVLVVGESETSTSGSADALTIKYKP